MVNSGEFANRINKILDYYELSASAFADKIDVGRSSISHILSGRNKPSLDFIMKVLHSFPEVDLYWLVNGKGNFKKSEDLQKNISKKPQHISQNLQVEPKVGKNLERLEDSLGASTKKVKKIILLYDDGSFESFDKDIRKY